MAVPVGMEYPGTVPLSPSMSDQVFAQVVADYHTALFRFALSLARNAADADDLTQQTFYVWATKGHTLRDASKLKTWLFTTLYREFLKGRRRSTRHIAFDDLSPAEQDPPDVEVSAIDRMDAELVLQALQEIPPLAREPLSLFYLQNLSYLEIAEILDVPIGTVMSRLSRGKIQLRALLARKATEGKIIEFPQQGTGS